MINEEEFDAFCNEQDRIVEKERNRQNRFIKDLEVRLIELVNNHFPEFGNCNQQISDILKKETHDATVNVNEFLDFIICPEYDDSSENPEDYKIPEPESPENERKELEEILERLPAERQAEFLREIDEVIKFQKKKQEFLLKSHHQVKEMITLHFPEIVDLPGKTIRNINFSSYCCMLDYKEAVYFIWQEYL